MDLEPLKPAEGVQMHLQDKATESSEATVRSHKSRLDHFIQFCKENDIENLNHVTGRTAHRYKLWRQDEINAVTLKTQMDTLRVFLRFCESIDAVEQGTADKVQSPSISNNSREETVERERQERIEQHFRKYEYASVKHTFIVLLMTGLRVSSIRAIDVQDVDSEQIEIVHRPPATALKNQEEGERIVNIDGHTREVLSDYRQANRHDVTDDLGREPLLTTRYGRPHIETLRSWAYQISRPCVVGDCPHDRDVDACDAAVDGSQAYACPSSSATHPWRRGAITHFLTEGAPTRVVSGRFDVSMDVIDEHYDQRDESQKAAARREWLDDLDD